MTTIALPERNILVPRLEFPAWVRHGRERASNMLAPLLGMLSPLAVSGSAPPWYLAGGAPTPIAAYQPKGAASLAASYVNLANPGTNDAAVGVAPTWNAATGWTGGGGAYLTTGINPGANYRSYTILVRFSGGTNSGYQMLAGYTDGLGNYMLAPYHKSTGRLYFNGNFYNQGTSETAGVMGIAGGTAYWNGSSVGAIADSTFVTYSNCDIVMFAAKTSSNTYILNFEGNELAVAIYGGVLGAPAMLAVSNAMAAL